MMSNNSDMTHKERAGGAPMTKIADIYGGQNASMQDSSVTVLMSMNNLDSLPPLIQEF